MSNHLEVHLLRQLDVAHRFFWHRARWHAVSTHLPSGRPFELVDVGAGSGVLATFLSRERPLARYRFVEPIESLRSFLREVHGAESDAGDHRDYRSADFVVALDVLEHQPDDRCFLTQLVDKMRPGATLLLTVPSGQRLWSQWDVSLGHYRRYDRPSLLQCTEGLPLDVRELTYLFPELVPLAALRAHRQGSDRGAGTSGMADESVALPDLPRTVNGVLSCITSCSTALRRWWPTGTSLFLVATRSTSAP